MDLRHNLKRMFGLNRQQLKNGFLSGLILFLLIQLWQESSSLDEEEDQQHQIGQQKMRQRRDVNSRLPSQQANGKKSLVSNKKKPNFEDLRIKNEALTRGNNVSKSIQR